MKEISLCASTGVISSMASTPAPGTENWPSLGVKFMEHWYLSYTRETTETYSTKRLRVPNSNRTKKISAWILIFMIQPGYKFMHITTVQLSEYIDRLVHGRCNSSAFSVKKKCALISIRFKYTASKESNTNTNLTPALMVRDLVFVTMTDKEKAFQWQDPD